MVQIYPEIATLPFVSDVARVSVVAQFATVRQTGSSIAMIRADGTWTCETLREQVEGLVAFAQSE